MAGLSLLPSPSFRQLVAALPVLLVIISLPETAHGWWPFSVGNEVPEIENLQAENEDRAQLPAKFEVSNVEQKFLAEAQKYLKLSPLEKCQHSVSTAILFYG